VKVRWVTPLGVDTTSTAYCCSSPSSPSHNRTPRPSRIGTWTTCRWSTSPAARKSRSIVGPPPIRTSCPAAAFRAASSASAGAASRKWNVVPPSISSAGSGRWVSTYVGVWNGGFSPHHPRHSGSSCRPGD